MKKGQIYFLVLPLLLLIFGCASNKATKIKNNDPRFLFYPNPYPDKKDPILEPYGKTDILELFPSFLFIPESKIHINTDKKEQEISIGSFYVSSTEITNNQYLFFLNNSDSIPKNLTPYLNNTSRINKSNNKYTVDEIYKNHPVTGVSYAGALIYTEWLTEYEARKAEEIGMPFNPRYRLLNYYEWQTASLDKAPKDTTTLRTYKEPSPLADYAWYVKNSERTTHEVWKKKGTNLNVHDIKGNVAEWVMDVGTPTVYDKANSSNPINVKADSASVCGGAYNSTAKETNYLIHKIMHKTTQRNDIGFRIGMTAIIRSPAMEF